MVVHVELDGVNDLKLPLVAQDGLSSTALVAAAPANHQLPRQHILP
jgi:hypothetical protein